MKKVLTSVIAIGCLAAAGSAYAGIGARTGVNGSLHDMTKVVPGTADAMGRVCVYCHAPHHAKVQVPNVTSGTQTIQNSQLPLWNHNYDTTIADFTPYTWATPDNLTAAGTIVDPLIGPSRLCMSCHDGVIAVDEHGSQWSGTLAQNPGTAIGSFGNGRANLTRNLSNTHPIGFDYITVAGMRNGTATGSTYTDPTNPEIVDASNHYADTITVVDADGTYNNVTRNEKGKTIADNLYNGRIMTCATCHDVHNKENVIQDSYTNNNGTTLNGTPNYFLYAKENHSLICLSCHIK